MKGNTHATKVGKSTLSIRFTIIGIALDWRLHYRFLPNLKFYKPQRIEQYHAASYTGTVTDLCQCPLLGGKIPK